MSTLLYDCLSNRLQSGKRTHKTANLPQLRDDDERAIHKCLYQNIRLDSIDILRRSIDGLHRIYPEVVFGSEVEARSRA